MDKAARTKLQFRIFNKIGGNLFVSPSPIENLRLGARYVLKIDELNQKRADMFARIRDDLSEFDDDQLAVNFSLNGSPLLESTTNWIAAYKREIDQSFRRLEIWYIVPLFRTDDLADFDHWSRAEYLSVDEVVWLSVGLEPRNNYQRLVSGYDGSSGKQTNDHVLEYVSRQKEMIRRKFDPHKFGDKPDLLALAKWIVTVKLDVHPSFLNMLSIKSALTILPNEKAVAHESSETIDGRERSSMAKLLAAIAIDAYGYDPKAKRSEIPNEIQGVADRLGLDLSANTIRKYLKKGSELLPDDWEPQ